jgi:hypothetical protein
MDIPPQKKKSECDIDYCPDIAEEPSFCCEVCEATIHPMSFNIQKKWFQKLGNLVKMGGLSKVSKMSFKGGKTCVAWNSKLILETWLRVCLRHGYNSSLSTNIIE